jgi:hypothetical protein
MYTMPSSCPICSDVLTVTRLVCPSCDTVLEGHFRPGRLEQLTPEQRSFVELFIACEGKLSWAAQELGISYPTVRARLEEVIRALGHEVREAPPAEERQRNAELRQSILDDLAAGKIESAEAIRLLQSR